MDKRSELPMALRAAYLAMHRATENAFTKHDVTADQFVLMATLERGVSMTQRELAQRMPSDPSTVRAMLVLLEKRGLVERAPHPEDSRALQVKLTAVGRRKFRLLWKAGDDIREQLYAGISEAQMAELVRQLRRIEELMLSRPAVEVRVKAVAGAPKKTKPK